MSTGRIGLSYDDGPSAWTPAILDLLTEHGAHATFFVIGSSAEHDPELIRRIHAEGHEVGNHTWSHPALARDCDDERVRIELERTSELLERLLGARPTLFRAPGYDCDDRVTKIAARLGLRHARGDVTPPDWLPHIKSGVIATMVVHSVRPGAIVGLHDGVPPREAATGATRQATVDALATILPALSARGLACVPVSKLLGV